MSLKKHIWCYLEASVSAKKIKQRDDNSFIHHKMIHTDWSTLVFLTEYDSMSSPVVRACYYPKSLLSSCKLHKELLRGKKTALIMSFEQSKQLHFRSWSNFMKYEKAHCSLLYDTCIPDGKFQSLASRCQNLDLEVHSWTYSLQKQKTSFMYLCVKDRIKLPVQIKKILLKHIITAQAKWNWKEWRLNNHYHSIFI